jgi:arylesterase/paraoxonase
MKTISTIIFSCLLITCVVYAGDTVHYMNFLGEIDAKGNAHCEDVKGLVGSEDMIRTRAGQLIISTDSRQEQAAYQNGAIMGYREGEGQPAVTLWNGNGKAFHPHGIDYYVEKDGSEFLFVVNHQDSADQVLIFKLVDNSLNLIREIPMQGIKTLNDILIVGPDQFYVTSDHGSSNKIFKMISDYLRLPTGSVLFYNGSSIVNVASGVTFANGIAGSPDGKHIYVASMLRGKILVYARDIPSGALHEESQIILNGSPDNITVSDKGKLIVATHNKIMALAQQRKSRDHFSPSTIQQVSFSESGTPTIETIFSDSGKIQSSASVGIRYGDRLAVGSLYGDHILLCRG